jgi:Ca2+/Na+ antiporter
VWNIVCGGWSETAKVEERICETNKQVMMLLLLFHFCMFVCHDFYLSYLVVGILISCSAYSLSDELQMFSIGRPAHLNLFKFSV